MKYWSFWAYFETNRTTLKVWHFLANMTTKYKTQMYQCSTIFQFFQVSDAASGWALAHPEFGSSVNPITDYAHQITASPHGFENPAASLTICMLF